MDVIHDASFNRFRIQFDDGEDATLEYRRNGDAIVFTHTEVPPGHEGQGIGGKLAKAALDFAREQHLTVVPRCPFVASYLQRHPEYNDMVDPDYRNSASRG